MTLSAKNCTNIPIDIITPILFRFRKILKQMIMKIENDNV